MRVGNPIRLGAARQGGQPQCLGIGGRNIMAAFNHLAAHVLQAAGV